MGLKYELAGMFGNKVNVSEGGVMSYGADFAYMYRHAASYVDKILRGAKPAELPVEQASKYYLAINISSARKIGLAIPTQLVARADEVIE
jgi:putative ABC transport system substrate-binding protein